MSQSDLMLTIMLNEVLTLLHGVSLQMPPHTGTGAYWFQHYVCVHLINSSKWTKQKSSNMKIQLHCPDLVASYNIWHGNGEGLFSQWKIKKWIRKENINKRKRKQVTRSKRKQVIRKTNTVYTALRYIIRPQFVSCDGVLMWLSVWSKVQIICTWSSWCHCQPISSWFIKNHQNQGVLTTQQVWFPVVFGRHLDENSVKFKVFELNSNEEACGDRPIRRLSQRHPIYTRTQPENFQVIWQIISRSFRHPENGSVFLVPPYPVCPGNEAVKWT